MLDRLEQLQQQADADLAGATDAEGLEQFRIKYLGSKGALKSAMGWLREAPADQKRQLGQGLNQLKQRLQDAYDQRKGQLGEGRSAAEGPIIDVTEPGLPPQLGREHILTQTMHQLIEVFARMGFEVAEGPEIEDIHHSFEALNIPPEHPARDPLDNFYLDENRLLRTHTSTVQIRVMESHEPPLRIVAPGRVYRPDTHDATHTSMFQQIEGLYVDQCVSMVDLKSCMLQFAHAFFGPEAEVRLRPSYFPFTEPSAELDVKIQSKEGEWEWMELGGCGMVDPAVFEAVGYDPEQWTGFAFGMGIERIAMRRYSITDIRWFYDNDVRFLRQF